MQLKFAYHLQSILLILYTQFLRSIHIPHPQIEPNLNCIKKKKKELHRSVKTNNNLYVSEPIEFKPVLSKFQQYYGSSHSKLVSAMSATDGIKEVVFDFFSFLLTLPLIPSSKMFLWQVVLLGEAH